MQVIIDRFEQDEAIVEIEEGIFSSIPKILIPDAEEGDVIECHSGHTEALMELYQKKNPKKTIPGGVMPMHYLIVKLHAVVVDYENQVYSDRLNGMQKEALSRLADCGMIEMHLADIHGKY